jgi:hypothetical protein
MYDWYYKLTTLLSITLASGSWLQVTLVHEFPLGKQESPLQSDGEFVNPLASSCMPITAAAMRCVIWANSVSISHDP